MENITRLTPFLSVAPQIGLGDFGTLSPRGFRAIISSRPGGEGRRRQLRSKAETA